MAGRHDQVLRALARGLFDQGEGLPEARLDWMLAELTSFLNHAGRTRLLFHLVVEVVEWLPLLLLGPGPRLSRLSAARRDHFLAKLDHGPLAIVLVLPKAMLALTYYEHPDALRETGYDQACLHGDNPALVQLDRGRP